MWWFRARLNIIMRLLKAYILPSNPESLLDFGAGTGFISSRLNQYVPVTAVDKFQETQEFNHFPIVLRDLSEYASESFDIVTAFDSLEHCKDDEKVIAEFFRILKPGGFVFITVPALQVFWSYHDVIHHHFRRYNKNEIIKKFTKFSIQPVKASYFNFFLFPFFAIAIGFIKIKERISGKPSDTTEQIPFLNSVFYAIFNLESALILSLNFPVGSSLVFIGKKCERGG